MPTAVEYALTHNWHTQNGCGGGPPVANEASLVQLGVPPAGELLLAGPLATLLLVAAVLTAARRRPATGRRRDN